ncbi:MAG: Gfo/Idh/MocA family oxidoreductase [Bacillales bacterium]|jgi:predicted dehydrogenase|nr:Gfo/Idh/MocA family oxidoreductase [Bacillales bacterium]
MENQFKWAVCGLGRISKRFVKVINKLSKNSIVIACVSSSKERAIKYQKKYNIKYALTYKELAESPSLVDAVYVCTNINMHHINVKMFLEKKIPILCEKTFSYDYKTAQEMIETAKNNNTLIMEAMWTKFLPATQYVTEVIKKHNLGKLISFKGNFCAGIGHGPNSRIYKKELCGGSILDLGVYLVHYSLMINGLPNKITTNGKVINGVDRWCNFSFIYDDNVIGHLRSSFKLLEIKEAFIINYENGYIKIPRFFDAKKVIVKTFNQKVIKKFKKVDGFIYEIEHFENLVRNKTLESPVVNYDTTLSVMEILEELNRQLGVTFY